MKMLNYLPLFLVLSACHPWNPNTAIYQKAISGFDEYKGTVRKEKELKLFAKEGYEGIQQMINLYVKETDSSSKESVFQYISLVKNPHAFYPENDFYLKVDDQVFKLSIEKPENELYAYQTNYGIEDSEDLFTNDVNTSAIRRFKVSLNQEMVDSISRAQKVSYRFYAGGRSSTFELNIYALEHLKEFLY